MKEEGVPRKRVADKSRVTAKVIKTERRITSIRKKADKTEEKKPPTLPIKKSEISVISVGKRPLQGTKEFVKIANSRSRGESIIRQPTTPAALHPKPIHIVNACFPQALHF